MGKRSSSPAKAGAQGTGERLAQALELQKQGNAALAEILYRGVLATEPRNARALCMLGLLQAQKGELTHAVELVGESVRIEPGNPATQFNLGLLYQQLGEHARALQCFDAALRSRPDAAQVH